MTLPTLHPLESSTIEAAGHDGAHLYVRFKGGAVYRYPGAEAAHLDAMKGHDSPGAYFQKNVRGAHKGERVEEFP